MSVLRKTYAARLLRVLACVGVLAPLAYWLLADTVRYHSRQADSGPVRLSCWGTFQELQMWREILAGFGAANPDVEVKIEYIPSRYEQKLQQLFVADAAPDVMVYQDEPFPRIVQNGKFEDLTRYAREHGSGLGDMARFWPTAVESFAGRSQDMYGLPVFGGCNLIYYNRRCFAKVPIRVESLAGPAGLVAAPDGRGWILDDQRWTVDDYIKVCQLLTSPADQNGRVEQFGFLVGYWAYWLPFQMTLGADILDASRQHLAFYGPAAEASLQLYQDMLFKYHVSPTTAELSSVSPAVGFYTGRVAMISSGPWEMPFCNAAGVDYDVLHIPRRGDDGFRATRVTWNCLAMFAGSKHKDKAWRLMQYVTDADAQAVVARYQRSIPALRQAGDAFVSSNPAVHARKFLEATGDYAQMQPITPKWDSLARGMYNVFSGVRNPDAAERMTVPQAIGLLLSSKELTAAYPPLDSEQANKYRQSYLQWKNRNTHK